MFDDIDFHSALSRSKLQRKILLVDVTASGSALSQVWVESLVIEMVRERAIAIQLDVDAQDVARQFGLQSVPTVIAFLEGREVDRLTNPQNSLELIAWIEDLVDCGIIGQDGPVDDQSLEAMRSQVVANPENMQLRMEFARMLGLVGTLEEATTEYLWLWKHMMEFQPSMSGVRHSYLVQDLKRLVRRHDPARTALVTLRDQVTPPLDREPEITTFHDWLSLNQALGDSSQSVRWFDSVCKTLPPTVRDRRLVDLLEVEIIPLLIAEHRWAEAGSLFLNPLVTLRKAADNRARFESPSLREAFVRRFRKVATELAKALHAANRIDDERALVEEARRLDTSEEMTAMLSYLSG